MEDSNINDYLKLKNEGNDKFRLKDYKGALECYTRAIETSPGEAACYSNRAACHINLKNYYDVLTDCTKAISLDAKFSKAYYRRAQAYQELSRYNLAISDFKKVLELEPDNSQVRRQVEVIEAILTDNTRIDLKIIEKPKKYQSSKPMETFRLNKQYTGSKLYNL